MDWDDIKLVLAVCRAGSLSGAAKALGINYSTVFRRINGIEEKLEVRLFDRQPGGYLMTEAGEAVMQAGERIDDEVVALSRDLLGRDLRLQGKIRMTAPEGVSLRLLTPQLAAFRSLHPDITFELVVTSSALSLSHREADIAVRATRKPPDNYVGREICNFRFTMYASPRYLKKNKGTELEEHLWVLSEDDIDFFPTQLWRKKLYPTARVVFSSNSTMAVLDAAKRGLGVTAQPCFLGDGEPGLVRLMDPPEDLTLKLWVLIHADLRQTARVRTLMTFLVKTLEQQKDAIEGVVSRR